MNFKEFYKSVNNEAKIGFLTDLLNDNAALQRSFLEKVSFNLPENTSHLNFSDFQELIAQYTRQIFNQFNKLDITNVDWDKIHDTGYYREEWEIVQDYAEEKIMFAFVPIKDFLLDCVISNRIEHVVAYECALYQVCSTIELEDNDDILGDMQTDTWMAGFDEAMDYITKRIAQLPDNMKDYSSVIELFFDFSTKVKNDSEFAKKSEKLLLALIKKSQNQELIYRKIEKQGLAHSFFPNIFNYLINRYENEEKWLVFALENYLKENEISQKLLIYLHEKDTQKFIEIAFILLQKSASWNSFLVDMLTLDAHWELFKRVHLNLSGSNLSLENYSKVEQVLSDNEKNKFIESIRTNWFKVTIFVFENRISEAKAIIEKEDDLFDFEKVVRPLFKKEPEFCFVTVRKFLLKAVEKYRGREYYVKMAEILKSALEIPNFSAKAKELIIEIYNYNSRLSALRSEIKNAGLM